MAPKKRGLASLDADSFLNLDVEAAEAEAPPPRARARRPSPARARAGAPPAKRGRLCVFLRRAAVPGASEPPDPGAECAPRRARRLGVSMLHPDRGRSVTRVEEPYTW